MFALVTLNWGGGEPAEVHFSVSDHPVNGTEVGLQAVKTAAGDILGAVTAEQQEWLKQQALTFFREHYDV